MADSLKLSATKRETRGKARHLRAEGKLPAVVYGHQLGATPIVLDNREFQHVFRRAGRTHLVDLTIEGGREQKVLVREVQTHPRVLGPVHVDFYRVSLKEKLQVDVPIRVVGDSPAVKLGEGDAFLVLHQVKVECLPGDIPEVIEVDISGLEAVDAAVRLGELQGADGVTILGDPEELVVKIASKRVAEAVEEAPAEGEAAEGGEAASEPASGQEPEAEA